MKPNLIIGSAQIGMRYGHNKKKITKKELLLIHKTLLKFKIRSFDTAPSYGNSEKIIGNLKMKKKIYSKILLPKIRIDNFDKYLDVKFNNSLKNLKVKKIEGLFVHNTADIIGKDKKKIQFLKFIKKLKKRKKVSKLGVSIYEPDELHKVLKYLKPDIIQLPVNILDHRFLSKNIIKTLKKFNIKIFARSVFLQGYLTNKIKPKSKKFEKTYVNFSEWCKIHKTTKIKSCIDFIKQNRIIENIVIGVENNSQLLEVIKAIKSKVFKVPDKFRINDPKIIDPRKWN